MMCMKDNDLYSQGADQDLPCFELWYPDDLRFYGRSHPLSTNLFCFDPDDLRFLTLAFGFLGLAIFQAVPLLYLGMFAISQCPQTRDPQKYENSYDQEYENHMKFGAQTCAPRPNL